jgi:hypothetical protein
VVKRNGGRNSLIRFFSNPVVGIIGSLASIAGIFLAIYFYMDAKVVPELTYFVNPAKAVIGKPGQMNRITVLVDKDTLRTEVSAVQVAFWNRGKQTIKTNNVLKSLVIYTEHGEPILETTIRKMSRDVVGVGLNQSMMARGRITVSWDILERNDGGVIQLIYAGGPDVPIRAECVLEGQSKIKRLEYPKEIKSTFDQYFSELKSNRLFQLKILAVCIVGIVLYIVLSSIFNRKRIYWYWEFFMMIIFIIQIFLWLFILSQPSGPPFGY